MPFTSKVIGIVSMTTWHGGRTLPLFDLNVSKGLTVFEAYSVKKGVFSKIMRIIKIIMNNV